MPAHPKANPVETVRRVPTRKPTGPARPPRPLLEDDDPRVAAWWRAQVAAYKDRADAAAWVMLVAALEGMRRYYAGGSVGYLSEARRILKDLDATLANSAPAVVAAARPSNVVRLPA